MSETKLTPAQRRAIREARENRGIFLPWTHSEAAVLCQKGLAYEVRFQPVEHPMFDLTPAGWAVEVGDE